MLDQEKEESYWLGPLGRQWSRLKTSTYGASGPE